MDLYSRAHEFPQTLLGGGVALSYAELRERGATKHALWWRANHKRLLRPHRGAYVVGRNEPDLLDAVRAALLVSPPLAVVGFHTAAALLGFGVVPSTNIHIVVPFDSPVPQRTGITAHQSVVPVGEPIDVLGVPCTPAARCVLDLARGLPRMDALPVLDAALSSRRCEPDDLQAELKLYDGLRGIRQARDLVPLADPRPQCRQESQLRLILHDGGIRDFVPQVPVLDDRGYPRHFLDLGDEQSRVAAEYDGTSHLDRGRLRADRDRHNWLEGRDWRMRYFTDHDIYFRAPGIIQTVNAARRAARSRAWSRG